MDPAVALVRAYLHANGYFTIVEYPIIESLPRGIYRTATDIDVLAVRFPGAGRMITRRGRRAGNAHVLAGPDPALATPPDQIDMIIAEVKEGRASWNEASRSPAVLTAALARLGTVALGHANELVPDLLRTGVTKVPDGPVIRLVAFGSHTEGVRKHPCHEVTLGQILTFLRGLADTYGDIGRHTQFKDPALGILALVEKARFYDSSPKASKRIPRGRKTTAKRTESP